VTLLEWDADGDTKVYIKPARAGESNRRSLIANRVTWEQDPDQPGREIRVFEAPGEERMKIECYLTFHDATIVESVPVDAAKPDGDTKLVQMFTKGMAEKDFGKAFDRLEDELKDEWHRAVLTVNPQWDEFGEGRATVPNS
jgi:hypothetical protein